MTLQQPELDDDDPRAARFITVLDPERGGWYPPEVEDES